MTTFMGPEGVQYTESSWTTHYISLFMAILQPLFKL